MRKAKDILDLVVQETDKVILFHSASGKDSITLLDLCASRFKEIVCVFMYIIKDLQHINRYINYATHKYSNIKFIQIPHYALFSYYNYGFLGCEIRNLKQHTLASLTELAREKTGIEWAIFGFKQSDSLNRRLMLRTYEMNGINRSTKKAYPLSEYKNKDVLEYIIRHNLIKPETYDGTGQSCGTDISSPAYLSMLKRNFPDDYQKVITIFPHCQRILFEDEYKKHQTESND